MSFREAVDATVEIRDAFQNGLRALKAHDRPHVTAEDSRRLMGSLDLTPSSTPAYQASS